jgi:hypothetical protein
MKGWIAITLFLLLPLGMLPQGAVPPKKAPTTSSKTARKPTLKPATVSGYVFALTEGGDIKPARMAKVYMLYSRPAGELASKLIEESSSSTSAAEQFRKEELNEDEKEKAWEQGKPYLENTTICRSALLHMGQGAIVDVLNWGEEHKTQFVFGDTDEEGKFEITLPPPDLKEATFEPTPHSETAYAPGVYLIVVIGTAGYNDALWEGEVTVEAGEIVKIKMSEPTKACIKTGSQQD